MAKSKSKSALRLNDAMDKSKWTGKSGKGPSLDNGIGNRAVKALSALTAEEKEAARKVYDAVIAETEGVADAIARAALLAAASDYTWTSLAAKALKPAGQGKASALKLRGLKGKLLALDSDKKQEAEALLAKLRALTENTEG